MSHVAPNPTDESPVRRWLSQAWAATRLRVARPAQVATYAFGKHPAFDDFIDVGRLPAVPAAFRHFHDVLRAALERDGGPSGPVLIGWREAGAASVVWAQPSRDRGDPLTGRFRRYPLLLGVTAPVALAEQLRGAGGKLAALAEELAASDGGDLFERINTAAAEWAAALPAAGEVTDGWPFIINDVVERDPGVIVAGAAERVAEGIALSSVSAATMGTWLARAAGHL